LDKGIFTRRGLDFAAALGALKLRSAAGGVLMAFDILHVDGEDLRGNVLEDRRATIASLLAKPATPSAVVWLQFSAEIGGEGAEVLRSPCEMGLEGIVSKRRSSP
jgi:bifunctional non-homologous end joining protein LigD